MTSIVTPPPRVVRRSEQNRLVYYKTQATADFWDEHWDAKTITPILYEQARQFGTIPTLMRLYRQYLPKTGLILEAGCGIGDMISVMQGLGLQAEGVEWGEKTVQQVLAVMPDLPIRVGDVTALAVPDGHYAGYLSLGVVEHRQAGPQPFLAEAYRILAPGGIALISVPYLHPIRRLKAALGLYRGDPSGVDFYQYAYSTQELTQLLTQSGFEVIDWACYDGYKGFKDELGKLVPLLALPKLGWRFKRWLQQSAYVEQHFGHMVMMVCRKPI